MRAPLAVLFATAVSLGIGLGLPEARAADEVDLALVLAVDVSRSMDNFEQQVQRDGYVQAFRHPDVIRAIQNGTIGKIAVSYMEWSGPAGQIVVAPWTVIDGEKTANAFADFLSEAPINRLDYTSISAALTYAASLLDMQGTNALRRVIDVSGDGPNNTGIPVLTARTAVLAKGITINGLPVMLPGRGRDAGSIPDLDDYYRNCVIGGPSAFIVKIENVSEFADATRRKLILEIADADQPSYQVAPSSLIRTAGPVPYDCLAGERQRLFFQP